MVQTPEIETGDIVDWNQRPGHRLLVLRGPNGFGSHLMYDLDADPGQSPNVMLGWLKFALVARATPETYAQAVALNEQDAREFAAEPKQPWNTP